MRQQCQTKLLKKRDSVKPQELSQNNNNNNEALIALLNIRSIETLLSRYLPIHDDRLLPFFVRVSRVLVLVFNARVIESSLLGRRLLFYVYP